MTSVLFIYEYEMPTVSITKQNWMDIASDYYIEVRFVQLSKLMTSDINWCDILVMIRPNNAFAWHVAKAARAGGRFVITMCDDDLLHLPKSHPDLPWQRKGLIKALKQSNVVMSSSRYLLDEMSPYTTEKRKAFADTFVKSDELLIRDYKNEKNDIITLVYAAGNQHEINFERYVLPGLKKVAAKTNRNLSITFISVHPQCGDLDRFMDVSYVQSMPLAEYRQYMKEKKFDIGLSPLEDNDFTRCKYYNKYLEYSLSGVMGIYSNVEPYSFVIRDGYNGLLADNNDDAWEEKLTAAIEDAEMRHTCARNAQQHIENNFSRSVIMERVFSEIPEFREKTNNPNKCSTITAWKEYYRMLRCAEFIYKAGFYMKEEGFESVKKKTISRLESKANR